MNFPTLPDWMPGWLPIVVLVPLGLWMLTMLLMPFSVIGVKSRLEGIELRLDEIQAEIRSLVLRLPESAAARVSYQDDFYRDAAPAMDQHYVQPAPSRPPIPPAPPSQNDFIPRRPDRGPDPGPRFRQDDDAPRDDRRRDGTTPAPPMGPPGGSRSDWRR